MDRTIETIYDIEKHIDVEYIENIIKNNQTKKIICFGGGTAADILVQKVLNKYKICCFLDNNKSIQGTKINGIEIKSPDILKELERATFLILVVSKHVDAISKQLEIMGLKKEQDYFDIYSKFIPYFRIKKFVSYARRFEKFVDRISDGKLESVPIKNTNKIGIVTISGMLQLSSWYPISQCILLRYRGYQTSLIIDCLHSFDDYIYFDGITDIALIYIKYIVEKIKKKWPSFDVLYIDGSKEEKLDSSDLNVVKKFAPVVVKWLDAQRDEVFLKNDTKRISKAAEILQGTMKNIKNFLLNNKFDVLNVHTGIHRHRYVYTYLGKKFGTRIATYDGNIRGTILYETDGIPGWAYDIRKLIEGNFFTLKEKKKLIEMAKENFDKRRNSTSGDEGYNFQKVKKSIYFKPYDVIIPLNVMWDAAALGLDDVFENEIEWLQETLRYLMYNTDALVMIREHPVQRMNSDFLYRNYKLDLPIIDKFSDRIKYVSSDADINTYQYIEQCKVVLPYASTVGLEAIMLDKQVVVHTTVYYGKYICKANSKEDYFEKIKNCLYGMQKNNCSKNNIYLAYLFQMYHSIKTKWSECFDIWLEYRLDELNGMEGVDEIIDIIIGNIPAAYNNLKKIF